jgi:hypothetical protein
MIKNNFEKNIVSSNLEELKEKKFICEKIDKNINKNKFIKKIKNYSIDDKIIFLGLLLEELYLDTKLDKFKNDFIFLEKWLWTLSDKKKEEFNINLTGSVIQNLN